MVRRHINSLRRWVVVAMVVLIFATAGLLSAGRGLLLSLPYVKPQLEQWISDAPHYQVRIGELNARWIQLSPRLEANRVVVELAGGRRIEVGRMEFQFNPLRSIEQGQVVFDQILLDQLDLSLFRSKHNGWQLAGTAERQQRALPLKQQPDLSDAAVGSAAPASQRSRSTSNSLLPLIDALLLHDELELRNATVQVQFEQHAPLPPQRINLKLQNVGEHHALIGQLDLGEEQTVELRSVLHRLPRQTGFSAEFYLNVPDIDQRFWTQLLPDDQPLPQQFVLGGEFWGSWSADGQHRLQGSLRVPRLRWNKLSPSRQNPPEPTPELAADIPDLSLLQVDDLALQLQLQVDGTMLNSLQQVELAITELQGRVDGIELPLSRLSARKQDDQWLASVEQLRLPPLWQLINGSTWVPDSLKQRLAGLDPVGQLSNARLQLDPASGDRQMRFQFHADLNQVGVSAWHGAPALQGVDGSLQIDGDGGRVDFESKRLGLNFPQLYRQGWQFDHARGVVDWTIEPQQVRVQSQRLQLAGDGITANGRFSLELPLKPAPSVSSSAGINSRQLREGQVQIQSVTPSVAAEVTETDADAASSQSGRLILMIGIEQADATLATRFVPDKIVPSGLFGWLDESIQAGLVDSGGMIIDLPLAVNKDHPLKPTVQMFFDVDSAELQYQPLWPVLSQANPYVLYKDGELLIELPKGRALQSQVGLSQVYLAAGSSLLQVDLQLDGPSADIRTALIEGPTGSILADGLTPWQLTGNSRSHLQLGVDLQQPQRSLIRITSDLSQGKLANPSLKLELDQLEGQLHYHERGGLSAKSLTGRLFDQPLKGAINTEQLADGSLTRIEANGRVEVARLNRWLQQPLLDNLSGTTDYFAKLEICSAAQACSNLRVDSQLQGVTALLPEPFGKNADQHLPLSVDLSLEAQPWLRLRYARQLDLLLPLAVSPDGAKQALNGGELVLGRDQKAAQKQPQGLSIRGRLERAEAEPWYRFITDNFVAEPDQAAASQADASAGGAFGANGEGLLQRLDVEVGSLLLGELEVEQLHTQLSPQSDGWLLQLDSPMAQGNVMLPTAPAIPQIELAYLRLPGPAQSADSAVLDKNTTDKQPVKPFDPQQDPLIGVDPRTLSAARVTISALSYGVRELGRWQFELQPQSEGIRIVDLNAKMGHVELQAEIDWRYQPPAAGADSLTSGVAMHSSDIELAFKTGNLEQAMQAWGTSMGLETESALLSGQFNWLGSPLAFNWQTLDGEAQLQADNGRMLDTGGSTQVLKLFSLFNSTTIWRRLSLDFSDLTKDGVSFDRISGHYRISDGMVNSLTPLTVTGPTIDLSVEGALDLVNETINQQMLVSLPISENLPVAAAFLATPAVAGAVFLVEKLIGDKLRKVTSVRYSISGDLRDPNISPIKPGQQLESNPVER